MAGLMEIFWTITAFLLTLMVLSYLIGDNPLFRAAVYIFVGVVAGYVTVLVIYQVIQPRIIWPLIYGTPNERMYALVPAFLSVLLLFKLSNPLRRLGNVSMAYIVGAGAAIVIGGAIYGTIVGQGSAVISTLQFQAGSGYIGRVAESILIFLGTISSLAYFHFGTRSTLQNNSRRPEFVEVFSKVGQAFVAITLGAVFAGVLLASLSALIDRLIVIIQMLGGWG